MRRKTKRYSSMFMVWVMLMSMLPFFVPASQAGAEEATEDNGNRTVKLTYEREDGIFDDWDVWVWNTGVQDNNIDFTGFGENSATAYIGVAQNTREIGFIVRKNDWSDREPNGQEMDRHIRINHQDPVTKVHIKQGETEFHTVPTVSGPVVDDGTATFFYRDPALYLADEMDTIEKVELSILGETYELEYESKNERFVYTYESLPEGEHEYTYLVTKDGETTEVTDPYNTVDGKSVVKNSAANVEVSGAVEPGAVDYNENAVLSVNVESDASIRELYADTTALGGPERLAIDLELNEITLSVAHDVTAGTKEISLTAVDEYGTRHNGTAELEVKTRQFVGDHDFDWDEAMIYFMLTDRFFDGDESNNDPYGMDYDTDKRGTYQGGDFKGITEQLDYLDDLGINTIWISPIVENIKYDVRFNPDDDIEDQPYFGYHGYWASDFTKLNPHFGSMKDFHELIDESAERGMKVMVDVVLNHTGYGLKEIDGELPEGERPEGYPTDDERAFFSDMLRQGDDVGGDEVTGELAGLPDFITEDPEVREQIIEWQTDWIEKSRTAAGNTIDYFRVDTVKHVEETTWMAFKNELTRKMPEFKMIGESWGADQDRDHGYLRTGTMDSLLDFGFKYTARDFANGNLEQANSRLETRNAQIDNTATLGQFLGSHDEAGFLEMVGGDEGKLKIAAGLQITAKGQPVIYYGEELGLSGGDNYPFYDNRYDMAWDQVEDNAILEHYQKLLSFRGEHSVIFARGDRSTLAGSNEDGFLLFERSYQNEEVYVGLNTSEEAQTVTLEVDSSEAIVTDAYSGEEYDVTDGQVTIELPAMSSGGTVLLTLEGGSFVGEGDGTVDPVEGDTLRIHYERSDNNYENWGLWTWDDVANPSENWPSGATPFETADGASFSAAQVTDFGAYVDVELQEDAEQIGFLVVNRVNGDKDGDDKHVNILSPDMDEVWIKEGTDRVWLYEPVDLPEDTVRINYERVNSDYEPWGLWTWGDVASPSDGWPDGATPFSNDQVGKYGAYVDLELKEAAQQINFLVVNRENGDQTGDMSFDQLADNEQLFIREGDETVYTNPYFEQLEGLVSGELLSSERIELTFTSTLWLDEEELAEAISIVDKDGNDVTFDRVTIESEIKVFIHGSFDIDQAPFAVTFNDRTVQASAGWRLIDEMYAYDGELGVKLHEDGTAALKLWSPNADNVSVIVYDRDDQYEVVADGIDMAYGDRGVWELTLDETNTGKSDLTGFYYHYAIERDGETKLALDPYAKSMAAWNNLDERNEIGKAAIVDPSALGPELDFADIEGFEKREDAIIYEIHVRDFTSDPTIDEELEAQFGTFAAFVERLDYIEDLGVTHVQLLPVMSYFWGDELANAERMLEYSSTGNNYNWGYDPHSYFSPTGMYSENPEDAELRIKELKNLIDEIHNRGMGVVLDVVYNHTAQVKIFEDLVPNYYHFMDADGTPRTSFGGGRLGTTHEMARRILVDSITYWTEEFKVDGFRFDMMGDHDAESIQIAYDKAKEINPNTVMIGEGWRTFVGDENGGDVMPADQDWMQHTESVGSFSDDFRNELKSGFGSEGQPRFITGGARSIQQIYDNLTANPHNFTATNPGDVVPYIAAHDNLTLHDVIAQSIKKDPEYHQEEIHKRIRLGNTMVLTAQGTAFLHAGQEFGRTKQFRAETDEAPYKSTYMTDENGNPFVYPYFIHDSYDSTDAINKFDWTKAMDAEAYPINNLTREYTTGLIELRRSTDAFRMGTMEDIDNQVSFIDAPEIQDTDLVIGYKAVSTDDTGTYYVFVNADDKERTLTLEEDIADGTVIVDGNEANISGVSDPSGFELTSAQITIDALTAVVVRVGGDVPDEEDEEQPGGPGNGNAPPHAGQPGPPPHAGQPGKPDHAGNPGKGKGNNGGK
ncbi:pullulanase [Bacillus sp. H-16]|uniref:pullulanase n=1 Tax=Alteribacter salitolerans TaxID=2912333 RepID=UPI001962F9A4|nr:pullulanase [Alteribacter salitolerans]MBM7095796.1 pullulanase [Alteribacter salitolerans]